MKQIDMSDKAVTARLKRMAQLRRLGLSLQKTKLPAEKNLATSSQSSKTVQASTRKPK